ncbi:MAG TPA: tRNA dimethylallyltransferase, partial [Tenuifilaceae bacterium]|nr:tRNA dimethylallyltransferase [Tenuifilaceae bacterium]
EARSLLHLRNLNSLNTVGYRELFDYFDGTISLQAAIELIKRNSRRYAKRQLTWWARDMQIAWFHPDNIQGISEQIEALASKNDE